ncbi:translation initiation factor 2 [Desulfocucumis palustris]|uniref:Translation initiation factor 2 n=1 Tax=Desulfocucumis palustris TaxID=1898651 RepID=A0A2L2XKU6_9FIRM|nr:hypothetical protein [Desulfocucumis palustris]GBF34551.1 translation initiation factor 2 [Desulfocucumis palustris]
MGILSEKEMYFKAAERAFYRNPFSDLLIVSFTTLNSDDESWKGLQLPVLLVPADGAVPDATRREIARRRRVNLYVWGNSDTVPDHTLRELTALTSGKVYRILGHEENSQQDVEDLQAPPPESSPETQNTPDSSAGDAGPDTAAIAPEPAGETAAAETEMAEAAVPPGETGEEAEKDPAPWQDVVIAEEENITMEPADSPAGPPHEEAMELTMDLAEENTTGADFEKSQEIVDKAAGEETAGFGLPGDEATTEAAKTPAELTEEVFESIEETFETIKDTPGETAEYPEESWEAAGENEGEGPENTDAGEETGEEAVDTEGEQQLTEEVIILETGYAGAEADAGGAETARTADEDPNRDSDAYFNGNSKEYGKNVIIWRFPS